MKICKKNTQYSASNIEKAMEIKNSAKHASADTEHKNYSLIKEQLTVQMMIQPITGKKQNPVNARPEIRE